MAGRACDEEEVRCGPRSLRACLALLFACSSPPPPPPAPVGCDGCLVLEGGRVFDGTSLRSGTVVVSGDRIQAVVYGPVSVVAGEKLSLSGRTVLPGLFDLHVHLAADAAPLAATIGEAFYEPHLQAMLRAGVTSFLDLGSPAHSIFALRSRIEAGSLLGPRIFAAGPLFTATGGHPCRLGTPPGDFCTLVDSAGDATAGVSRLLPYLPDVVKVVLEPGTAAHPLPRLRPELLAPIAQASGGVPLVAHVSSVQDVEDGLDAGIRIFAHVPIYDRISPDLAARLAREHATIITTLSVMTNYHAVAAEEVPGIGDPALHDDVPDAVIASLTDPMALGFMTTPEYIDWTAAVRDIGYANFATLLDAGVNLVAGTDAGNPGTFHGLAVRQEIALFVQNGMRPVDALSAATRRAADLLGHADLGRIEAGAQADLVVVDGDPSADVGALGSVVAVLRAGRRIDRDALRLTAGGSLVITPTAGAPQSAACLGDEECAAGLVCAPLSRTCAPRCAGTMPCASGSACIPITFARGYCLAGDGCDLLRQGCANGTACIFLGNAATLCGFASSATAGESCGAGGTCAPGLQCDDNSGRCAILCDPSAPNMCPSGGSCQDRSAQAGLTVGECSP
jgi:imidazolonepropionase-like amidohydrolase